MIAKATIADAVAALKRGDLVAMPTETVYGLAADARNPEAIRKVFEVKSRPPDHPLIVHLHSAADLDQWADPVPDLARALAARFWPGPLTLILRRRAGVSDLITGGQDTVGLRVPAHPLAQELLRSFGSALVAPSANRYGRISPTSAAHVYADLGAAVAVILDGGSSVIGLESSIVDLSQGRARLLRPGSIAASAIAAVTGELEQPADDDGPRASGRLAAHYAPRTPLDLVSAQAVAAYRAQAPTNTLWLAVGALPENTDGLALPNDAAGYGRELYAALRELDARQAARIAVLLPPSGEDWAAVHDRLRRASVGSVQPAGV